MKVLIATPAYGGVVTTIYHQAVLALIAHFRTRLPEVEFQTHIISISMISTARNIFASMVLADPSITHLLFLDADMGFTPTLIERMVRLEKPVTGVVYPQRMLDYEDYHQARGTLAKPNHAKAAANTYVATDGVLGLGGSTPIEVIDGFVRVAFAGTGIMLIERSVIEEMRERFPELWVANPPAVVRKSGLAQGGLLQCFEAIAGPDGFAQGEDISFCKRWTEVLGGEIWANVDELVAHAGQETYIGHFMTRLAHQKAKLDIKTSPAKP